MKTNRNHSSVNKKEKLAVNTMILGIGTICSKCLSFIFVPLFSHWLSTAEYGDFDLFVSYVSLIVPFMTLSTTEALFRFLIDEKDLIVKRSIVTNCAVVCTVSSATVSCVVLLLLNRLTPDIAISFVAYLLAEMLYTFMTFFLRGTGKLNIYASAGCINVVVTFLAVLVLVRSLGMGTAGMLYGYAIAYAITALVIIFATKFFSFCDLRLIDKATIGKIIKYSWPMIPQAISWWVVNVSDRTIINTFLGSVYNGLYALANKFPNLCTTLFSVFNLSWQENISLTINDKDRNDYINDIYNKLTQIIISISLPVLGLNYFMFKFLFDVEYFGGSYQVPILMWAVIFNVIERFLGGIFVALKRTKLNGYTTVVGAIVNILVHLVLVKYIGLYAASVSTLVAFFSLYIVRIVVIDKKCNIKLHLTHKTILFYIVYILFVVLDYLYLTWLSCLRLLFGCLFFVVVNKSTMISVLKKIKGH